MAKTSDIRNGLVIRYKGELVKIVEFLHQKMGRGGAKIKCKMKSIETGAILENTFRSGESIETVRLDAKKLQYSYFDGLNHVFMDQENFEEILISDDIFGEVKPYVKETEIVKILFDGAKPVDIEIPSNVELEVADTEPGLKGDRVTGATKAATMQTGLVINVPLFINTGDIIKIDTRTGEYLERVSN
ncbi:MAG: elongation factor P [Candidatus Marinimicrobia bacterium]|nr:elongation factor P [Candidatus Neomarinimicrobiota bacterium]